MTDAPSVPSIAALAAALAAAQGEMSYAPKDSTNPHFKNRYADLASVWAAVRAPLAKHGLCVIQLVGNDEGGRVMVETVLAHKSGESITSRVAVRVQEGAQAMGSAITYLRRYALMAMVGIAADDDDGEAASPPPAERPAWPPESSRRFFARLKEIAPLATDATVNAHFERNNIPRLRDMSEERRIGFLSFLASGTDEARAVLVAIQPAKET